jgi:ankyrin repeat protein
MWPHIISSKNNEAVLSILLSRFPRETWVDQRHRSLLYYSLLNENINIVELILLHYHRYKHSLNETVSGVPLLALAARLSVQSYSSHLNELKEQLIAQCVESWNNVDSLGRTVLHNLLYFYLDIDQFSKCKTSKENQLLAPNKSTNDETKNRLKFWLSLKDDNQRRHLRTGTSNFIISLTILLCKMSFDTAALVDCRGNTVVHLLASSIDLLQVFLLAIEKFPRLLVGPQNAVGTTVLHVVARHGPPTIFQCIADSVVQKAIPSSLENEVSVPQLLLEAFSQVDLLGCTPLHVICELEGEKEMKAAVESISEIEHSSELDFLSAHRERRQYRAASIDSTTSISSEKAYDAFQIIFSQLSCCRTENTLKSVSTSNEISPSVLTDILNAQNWKGETILHILCQYRALNALKYLLEFARNTNIVVPLTTVDRQQFTAFHYAVSSNSAAIVRLLLNTCSSDVVLSLLSSRMHNQETCFHMVARQEHSGFVTLFLELVEFWQTAVLQSDSNRQHSPTQSPFKKDENMDYLQWLRERQRQQHIYKEWQRSLSLPEILQSPSGNSVLEILASSKSFVSLTLLERLLRDELMHLPTELSARTIDGRTALHLIAANPAFHGSHTGKQLQQSLLRRLFVSSETLCHADHAGNTVLHCLAKHRIPELIMTLVNKLTELSVLFFLCEQQNKEQHTFLSLLLLTNWRESETTFSENPLSLNLTETSFVRDDDDDVCSILTFQSEVDSAVTEELCEESDDEDVNSQSSHSENARHKAGDLRVLSLIKDLMQKRGDNSLGDNDRCLVLALSQSLVQTATFLLHSIAQSPDARTIFGRVLIEGMPLSYYLCIHSEYLSVFQMLLERYLIVLTEEEVVHLVSLHFEGRSMTDVWFLMCQSPQWHGLVTAILHCHCLDVMITRECDGRSAMHIAANGGDYALLKLFFLLHAVDIEYFFDERDHDGNTPFDLTLSGSPCRCLLLDEQTSDFHERTVQNRSNR